VDAFNWRSKALELMIDPWSIEEEGFSWCPLVAITFFNSEQFLAALAASMAA